MPESLLGQTLAGKYLVEGVLGDGGMGTVVVARHIELDERVAIKLLRDELAHNELVVSRFLREGKIAARIRSTEHIVKVRDIGRLENGVPFMVMELLQGEDLETRLDRDKRLPISLAVDFVLQACDALSAAHDAGIVHRDIKPGNLFLTTRRNGSPSVKVLDFGISKLEGDLRENGHRTSAQEIFGSPFYMSPEQLLSSADVDHRADIYSLGVVLYEMLTSHFPFEADVLAKLHLAVLSGDAVDVRDHGVSIPDELADVVHGCLQRDRGVRYQSMRDFANALEPFASVLGLEALEAMRQGGLARSPSPSISSEWAAYTEGRSLAPPSVASIPPPRMSQRSIPTYISEPKVPVAVPKELVSGKTLTPWANTGNNLKRSRVRQFGIAGGLVALFVLGGGMYLAFRSSDATNDIETLSAAANASLAVPATAPSAAAKPEEVHSTSFEIIEAAQPDAGSHAAVTGGAKNARPGGSAPTKKPEASAPTPASANPATKPSAAKLPDDRN